MPTENILTIADIFSLSLSLSQTATKSKFLRRGVKEVVKALRKKVGSNGLCIIAGDISPVDVITHIPILCEENDIPYVFVPSKHDLGESATTKRPTSCVMIIPGDDWKYAEKFGKLRKKVKALCDSHIKSSASA